MLKVILQWLAFQIVDHAVGVLSASSPGNVPKPVPIRGRATKAASALAGSESGR
jgi:hypothetical protein